MRCHTQGRFRMYNQYGPSWKIHVHVKKLDEPYFCYGSNPVGNQYGWCKQSSDRLDEMRGNNPFITEENLQRFYPETRNLSQSENLDILAQLNMYAAANKL